MAAPEITEVNVNVLQLLMEGGWYIMLPLALMSLIGMYVFFERFLAIQKADKVSPDFMNRLKDYISQGNLTSARNLCAYSNTPLGRMLDKGISRIGKPLKDISVAIENVGKLEIYRLEKNLSTLATVAGAAPMVGFLGTVIGMVNVFLDMEAAGTVQVSDISSGTKQAMVTTIVGLVVGILAYMAYNHLVSKVSKVVHRMEANSLNSLTFWKNQRKDESGATQQSQLDGQHVVHDGPRVSVAHLFRDFVHVGEQWRECGLAHEQGHDVGDVPADRQHPIRWVIPPQWRGASHFTHRFGTQAQVGNGQAGRESAVPPSGQERAHGTDSRVDWHGQGQPMEGHAWLESSKRSVSGLPVNTD